MERTRPHAGDDEPRAQAREGAGRPRCRALGWTARDQGESGSGFPQQSVPGGTVCKARRGGARHRLTSARPTLLEYSTWIGYQPVRTATDPQCQRVFDVVTHKCEYLGEMAGVMRRVSSIQKGCVDRAEKTLLNAIRRKVLPATVDARLAAIGLDALIYGLISNWLTNRDYVALERKAEALIDLYIDGLRRPVPAPRQRRTGRRRASVP